MKIKKKSCPGRYKREKESNWDPEGEQASSPLRGVKKIGVQKRSITSFKMKIKKKLSRDIYKKERESNWDPEGEQASSPLRGIKKIGGQKG